MTSANNLILNGFDRCGSSAISKVLAAHPQIELIFHPFNSGSIRRKMYQVMTDEIASDEDARFFAELEQGRFWRDYVVSPWFEKHSTVLDFVPGRLHVLKTTLNHLTIRWIRERFPAIEFWGIWRDPFDILASLVRNEFYGQWYLDALPQLAVTVRESGDFSPRFGECLESIGESEVKALAFLIAARSYFFFNYLEPEKLINYEVFKTDPNAELNKITRHFGLAGHSFEGESDKDHNVIGLGFEKGKTHRHLIGKSDGDFAAEVFDPLFVLMERRFGSGPWRNRGEGARA
jgi:hypothetical protein